MASFVRALYQALFRFISPGNAFGLISGRSRPSCCYIFCGVVIHLAIRFANDGVERLDLLSWIVLAHALSPVSECGDGSA